MVKIITPTCVQEIENPELTKKIRSPNETPDFQTFVIRYYLLTNFVAASLSPLIAYPIPTEKDIPGL